MRGGAQELSGDEPVRNLSLITPKGSAATDGGEGNLFFFCFVLYILIVLNITFTSLPHIANILSCSLFGLFFGCGEAILCGTKERNSQLYPWSARCSMK